MMEAAARKIIWPDALALADEINDCTTCYLIERALDEARAQLFKPFMREA
jgi:hypothetical protein